MKHILLTGATGVLGSEVLYELLIENLLQEKNHHIYLLVRPKDGLSAIQRVQALFSNALMPEKLWPYSDEDLLKQVNVISGSIEAFDFQPKAPITLIHAAASVNLNNKSATKKQIKRDNYEATIALAKRFASWPNEQLIFVSTAYSCGVKEGVMNDDFLQFDEQDLLFRNAYEEYKFKAEKTLAQLADKHQFTLSIARPSIICGRLVEKPYYVMNRYIVFYLVGKFFQDIAQLLPNKDQNIRLKTNKAVDINIIPVDYVAKSLIRLMSVKHIQQLNIVNSTSFPAVTVIQKALRLNGFTQFSFVTQEPQNKSLIEKYFYNTVALQLLQYVQSKHHSFNTSKLREIMEHVVEPNIGLHFHDLFEFAHQRNFKNQIQY